MNKIVTRPSTIYYIANCYCYFCSSPVSTSLFASSLRRYSENGQIGTVYSFSTVDLVIDLVHECALKKPQTKQTRVSEWSGLCCCTTGKSLTLVSTKSWLKKKQKASPAYLGLLFHSYLPSCMDENGRARSCSICDWPAACTCESVTGDLNGLLRISDWTHNFPLNDQPPARVTLQSQSVD